MNRTEEILFNLHNRREFYPDEEVRSLVPLGLVEIRKSRYAEYAVLTLDGFRQASKVMARETGRVAAVTGPAAGTSRRSERRLPVASEKQAGPERMPVSPEPVRGQPLKPAPPQRPPAKQRATPPPSVTANACRVTLGGKVTYYPVASYGALNGDKTLVATINKFYRSYPVAASVADVVVPGKP